MTIHFIGAGPGDPELLTLKAHRLISSSETVLYAGSLIPLAILEHATNAKKIVDTSACTLENIEDEFVLAHNKGHDVARLHSGDLSLYTAIHEQVEICDRHQIPWEITPGVPSFSAAAARLGISLTLPNVSQTVILSRTSGRASKLPDNETLTKLAEHRATLVLHLSIQALAIVVRETLPILGPDYPIAVAYAVGWPDELIITSTLKDIRAKVKQAGLTRHTLIIIGSVLKPTLDHVGRSRLYDPTHSHTFRKVKSDLPNSCQE